MPGKIFINYRRDDDPAAAARVRDGLAEKFGKSALFMDVDNLLAGQRFDQELAKALSVCDVLVAVIGTKWMDLMRARAASPERDYVREEIAEALKRKVLVVPVRVGREGKLAPLPGADDLPEDIRDLVLHQKHDVTYERHGRDVVDLAAAIETVRRGGRRVVPWRKAAAGVMLVAMLAAVGVYGLPQWGLDANVEGGREIEAARARPTNGGGTVPGPGNDVVAGPTNGHTGTVAEEVAAAKTEAPVAAPPAGFVLIDSTLTPGTSFRDCDDCQEMVVVPAGRFTMGSPESEAGRGIDEGPQREVTIAKPFAVGKFEVTFEEWDACVSAGGCYHEPVDAGWGRGKRPVINVSWDDAKRYVSWLTNKTERPYRLLTEAEWEYAARAGTTTPFNTGKTITTEQANFNGTYTYGGSAQGQFRQQTVDAGSFKPNSFGLHDMHGNVWEWVVDCYRDSYTGAPSDGSSSISGNCSGRVLRGGSWIGIPSGLRSAYRYTTTTSLRDGSFGFRVARDLE